MATPHIGGIATLLLAAAPSLGVANYQIEDHDSENSLYFNESAKGLQFDDWEERNESRVHEIELILELTAHYDHLRNSCEEGNDDDGCSDIPEECYVWIGPIDAMTGEWGMDLWTQTKLSPWQEHCRL